MRYRQKRSFVTDGRTNQPTNKPTDQPTNKTIQRDASLSLDASKKIFQSSHTNFTFLKFVDTIFPCLTKYHYSFFFAHLYEYSDFLKISKQSLWLKKKTHKKKKKNSPLSCSVIFCTDRKTNIGQSQTVVSLNLYMTHKNNVSTFLDNWAFPFKIQCFFLIV